MKKQNWLKDGFVVVGQVSGSGCTSYGQSERTSKESGKRVTERWVTNKEVKDKEEQERLATTVRGMRYSIASLGVHYDVFTFVPLDQSAELEQRLKAIEQETAEYNRTAKCTSIRPNYIVYSVGGNDARVAKVMYDRLIEVADQVNKAISAGNVRDMRWWLSQLAGMTDALPQQAAGKLSEKMKVVREKAIAAVKAAKKSAGDGDKQDRIVKEIKKIGGKPVAAIRAALVETAEQIKMQLKNKPILPTPRSVEG